MTLSSLSQRVNAEELFASAQQFPVGFQVFPVDYNPGFQQLQLVLGNAAFQNGAVQRHHNFIAGVFCVKVRDIMLAARKFPLFTLDATMGNQNGL